MASAAAETLIGAVVLAAAGGFLVYAAQTADIRGGSDGYEVVAKFVRADGLTVGGDVRMAGVKIGTITSFELDNTTFEAVATMQIRDEIAIPQGSSALVASDGLAWRRHRRNRARQWRRYDDGW